MWRGPTDIQAQHDLVEEIARMYGFDALPQRPYTDPSRFVAFSPEVLQRRALEDRCVGTGGYSQTETYPRLHQRRQAYIA